MRREFFAKGRSRAELGVLLASVASILAVRSRTWTEREILALGAFLAFGWWVRKRPILVLDESGVRFRWLPRDRFVARSEVASWSIMQGGNQLAVFLRSQDACVVHLVGVSVEDRAAIAVSLTEAGYPQIQPGDTELAAIARVRRRMYVLWLSILFASWCIIWIRAQFRG